ncbi:DnaJ and TPR domain protein [Aspergillus brunneoviolaceus CBS 621.78]|uniref:DsRNA-activated protein kinase inhibitor n=1 Tax=Aspergillus brunneoviolaceus CBS 621.78 TaxID=1450534 RepID=A0ACD1GGL2_9EURO|nr:dsRNA-activated protein kinase inhibitor [Aspergillus brunneoviolaceus CBS 621.78]RAH48383.1 dsRNA-activated protein kinase inhibitor [Aspergillus brunneoviolaceus CBS 621.78]
MFVSPGLLAVFLAFLSVVKGWQPSPISHDTPLSSLIASAKTHLAGGSPRDALQYFDAAISRDPANYLVLFQRGAAYLSLGKNSQALADFDRVLQLKPGFESALLQRSRLRAKSADWAGALEDLGEAGKGSSPEFNELQEAHDSALLAQEAEKLGSWDVCVSHANVALSKASMSLSLRQTRAHCRFERGEIEEGLSDLAHVSQISPGSLEPHLQISSMLFYSLGDYDRGIFQIRKCLHSDPDSKICNRLYRREKKLLKRIQTMESAATSRKFNNVVNLLVGVGDDSGLIVDVQNDVRQAREAGYIHPAAPNRLYASLVEKTCEAYQEIQIRKLAASYCSQALDLNPSSLAGLLYKGQVAIDEDRFEDAISVLNDAKEHHPNSKKIQDLLQKAHVLQKRSRQKDYYKVLGVTRDADERTIKRAYRQLTKQHHPDKVISRGVSKEEAEKKMAAINEAYEVLSDPELRGRYDNGDDPNDPESQRGNPFQSGPFGSGQQFFFQQGGPQFKFSGQGFNFPGGGFPFR